VVELVAGFAPELMAIMHTPLEAMNPALDLLSSRWSGPIGAYAELPYPEDPDANFSASTSPEAYATGAGEWRARGAAVIGGCCGTTPAHIAALSARFGAKSGAQ
jgi:S-methylmethionine-dependent homocysteine/selenocysteine methylase